MMEFAINPKTGIKIHTSKRTHLEIQKEFSKYVFSSSTLPLRIVRHRRKEVSLLVFFPTSYALSSDTFESTKIGAGSFGTVYELKGVKTQLRLAVKLLSRGRRASSNEIQITAELSAIRCNQLKARIVPSSHKKSHVIVMEAMDGSLMDLITKRGGRVSMNKARYIMRQVQKQLVCLYKKNRKYVNRDLKLENILYKKSISGKKMRIYVGDLGSFDNHTTTYQCYRKDTPEQCMSLQLGLLFAQLVGFHSDVKRHFTFRKRKSLSKHTFTKKLQQLIDKINNTYNSDSFECPYAVHFLNPDVTRRTAITNMLPKTFEIDN